MAKFDVKEIERLASLSALNFTAEEIAQFAKEFESISNFVQAIADAKIDCEKFTASAIDLEDLRKDEIKTSLPIELVLQNSPKTKSNSFCVPKMIE